MTKLIVALAVAPFAVFCYALMVASSPRTQEERDIQDQEQTEYLQKWNEEHKKKKK